MHPLLKKILDPPLPCLKQLQFQLLLSFFSLTSILENKEVRCPAAFFLMDGDGKPVQATETEHIYSCFKPGLMIKKLLNKEIFKMDRQVGPKILPSSSHENRRFFGMRLV